MKKTKRLIPLLLAALMCFSLIVPVSAEADPEIEYVVKMDNWSTLPTKASTCGGFQMLDAYMEANGGRPAVENGVLYLMTAETKGDDGKFPNSKTNGKFDLQLNAISKETAEDITLSMQIKPIGKFSSNNFIAFRTAASPNIETTADIQWVNNTLKIGETASKVFPTDAFTTVEFQLYYENGAYTKVDCYVDGVKLGTVSLKSDHTKMSLFRMLATSDANTGYAVGSVALFKGHGTLYTERDYISHSDFTRFPAVPVNTNATESAIGWRAHDGYVGNSVAEDGQLKLICSSEKNGFFDLLPSEKNGLLLTYDFTLSTQIKLNGETWWTDTEQNGFMAFRDRVPNPQNPSNLTNGTSQDYFFTKQGKIGMKTADGGTVMSGVLPENAFTTVEWMFQYDEANNCYTEVSCYINGVKLGNCPIKENTSNIGFFRMFYVNKDNFAGQGVSIDSLSVVKGCRSLYTGNSDVVSVKGYQTTDKDSDNTFDLRLVGLMHDETYANYDKVGFAVEVTYGSTTKNTTKDITTIYSSITAGETEGYVEYTAETLGGEYIYVLNCRNIPANQGEITFTVTPYYQTVEGGVRYAGVTKTFTVDPTDIPDSDLPETEPAN